MKKKYLLFNTGPYVRFIDTASAPLGADLLREEAGQWLEADEIPENLSDLTIVDGALVPVTEAILADRRRMVEQQSLRAEKESLLRKLERSDYKAIKYAEGSLSEPDFALTKQQRQQWRDRIREIEKNLK